MDGTHKALRNQIPFLRILREQERDRRADLWKEMLYDHVAYGCSLDKDPPRMCVIHGMFKGDAVMTKKDWMGNL